jgi:para-nitrobenzyl esterase
MANDQKSPFGLLRAVLVGLTTAAAILAGGSADGHMVTTPGGTFPAETYQGLDGNGITTFLGIRYAAAPTGVLRFAPPTAPAAVSGTINATSFGSPCPQTPSPFGIASANEDCLFLDVYVPGSSVSPGNNLPVMVFFHPSLVYGLGGLYDPTNMAIDGSVIIVTVNYRLGILGYLADAALGAESERGISGNYGFRDQLFALRWVEHNIGAFGGNAHNVTIFGESAGGVSVCAAVVSPFGTGLFQRAISESAPCISPLLTLARAEALGATIVSALGCTEVAAAATVDCLRHLSVDEILAEQSKVLSSISFTKPILGERFRRPEPFLPIIDGVLIPQQPTVALVSGNYNQVPVIEGTNHDEGRLFVALEFDLNPAVGPLTAAEYPAAIESIVSGLVTGGTGVQTIVQEIVNEYPLSNFAVPGEALAAVITDGFYSCMANISNERFSLSVPTFGYEFNDENAPMLFYPPVSFPYGATHSTELSFIFSVAPLPLAPPPLSGSEQILARTMKSYWTTFAKNGNPNKSGAPYWARFQVPAKKVQSLIPPTPKIELDFATKHNCGFWEGLFEQTVFQPEGIVQ